MALRDLVLKTRSYRKFHQDVPVKRETLKRLVDIARLSASAGNLQPLKYILCNEQKQNAEIFSCLSWAVYLNDWNGPAEGEKPPAYIIVVGDTDISKNIGCDHGIAVQSLLLAATEEELGGCILTNINGKKLRKLLKLPVRYRILLVVAIGKPQEKVTIDRVGENGDIKYWRDYNEMHHVPKRVLNDVILDL